MFLATEITYNLDEGTSTSKSKMAFMNDVRGGKVSNKQKNQYFRERWRKTIAALIYKMVGMVVSKLPFSLPVQSTYPH